MISADRKDENLHEGFPVGTRVEITDICDDYKFYGKRGVVIGHPSAWQSKVKCDDGSEWIGNKYSLRLSAEKQGDL